VLTIKIVAMTNESTRERVRRLLAEVIKERRQKEARQDDASKQLSPNEKQRGGRAGSEDERADNYIG
jgi:hypothetical protein